MTTPATEILEWKIIIKPANVEGPVRSFQMHGRVAVITLADFLDVQYNYQQQDDVKCCQNKECVKYQDHLLFRTMWVNESTKLSYLRIGDNFSCVEVA
ncbi:hypothetical protein DUE52_27920 [Larkinella punicea]|uniref:Uncharacterized protein n=1 Tax=Larkinella punicea TaxID=2315727 RepID=A0A368JHM2_9BACT|nr:hypothetical protein DUE52_27920 [Larkinella punicea]